jgi:sugar phosphate permease
LLPRSVRSPFLPLPSPLQNASESTSNPRTNRNPQPDLVAYLDRSNIGNAKIAGLDTSLKLTSASYQWLLTIFYISYILFEPFALMWKLLPPHLWAAICVFGWGIAAICQAGATSWAGMMAARFFLGMFEAGYGPGIPFLLSFFYLRRELGVRIGVFLSAAPLATCFAGALAYGITSGHPAIQNWQVLFLVEGMPTLVLAVVAYFFLPDSPETARFLTPEEKEVARMRGVRQVGGEEEHRLGRIHLPDVAAALLDLKVRSLLTFSRRLWSNICRTGSPR